MPPEAYDDMKVNDLRGRDVAGIIANEDRDVTPGTSSPEEFYQSKVWKAHAIINGDRTYGDLRLDRVHTAPSEVTPELENSPQYQQALAAARQAFQEQLGGKDPTDGRMFFNNRYNEYLGPRKIGNGSQEVVKRFGPFQYGSQKVYTVLYENLPETPAAK